MWCVAVKRIFRDQSADKQFNQIRLWHFCRPGHRCRRINCDPVRLCKQQVVRLGIRHTKVVTGLGRRLRISPRSTSRRWQLPQRKIRFHLGKFLNNFTNISVAIFSSLKKMTAIVGHWKRNFESIQDNVAIRLKRLPRRSFNFKLQRIKNQPLAHFTQQMWQIEAGFNKNWQNTKEKNENFRSWDQPLWIVTNKQVARNSN